MELNTKYHGVLKYEEKDIVRFPKGLPGFVELKEFILVNIDENPMFKMLHSIEDKDIGLVVISPFDVMNEYEFELSESVINNLEIEEEKEVLVVNTVTINSNVSKITVNLRAPIVININKKLGEQIILANDTYEIKHPLVRSE